MNKTINDARSYRQVIELAMQLLDDELALTAIPLHPEWSENAIYEAGTRVQYNEVLYRCLMNHNAQADWTPEAAPSLWAKVLIPDANVIPEWEQPESTNGYMIGDKVRYNDIVYESLIDNNIWSPEAYPAGWKAI